MKLPPGPTAKRVILIMKKRYVRISVWSWLVWKFMRGAPASYRFVLQCWPLADDGGWGFAKALVGQTFWGLLANGETWRILNLFGTKNREAVIKSAVIGRVFGENWRWIPLGKTLPCHQVGLPPKNFWSSLGLRVYLKWKVCKVTWKGQHGLGLMSLFIPLVSLSMWFLFEFLGYTCYQKRNTFSSLLEGIFNLSRS